MQNIYMRAFVTKFISITMAFNLVLSYSGFAISSCDCCNGDQVKKEEAVAECCHDEITENQTQSICHSENSKNAPKQKLCDCPGDCECSFLCNMPDYNNAVITTIHQFPNKELNRIIQQPIIFIVEHFNSLFIHFKPDEAALNPLKFPLIFPLRI